MKHPVNAIYGVLFLGNLLYGAHGSACTLVVFCRRLDCTQRLVEQVITHPERLAFALAIGMRNADGSVFLRLGYNIGEAAPASTIGGRPGGMEVADIVAGGAAVTPLEVKLGACDGGGNGDVETGTGPKNPTGAGGDEDCESTCCSNAVICA